MAMPECAVWPDSTAVAAADCRSLAGGGTRLQETCIVELAGHSKAGRQLFTGSSS
jgi:hypothetical protein